MKRFFITLIVALAITPALKAQTSVSFDNPDIVFKFKRCVCSGKTAFIDFLITNNSPSDIQGFLRYDEENCSGFPGYYTAAYDDEGNIYTPSSDVHKLSRINIADAGPSSYIANYSFPLPAGVPVKMRVTLTGVDEYAAEIALLKVTFRSMKTTNSYGIGLLEAKHLPIIRDQ